MILDRLAPMALQEHFANSFQGCLRKQAAPGGTAASGPTNYVFVHIWCFLGVFYAFLYSESVDSRIGANFLQKMLYFREFATFIELLRAFLHSQCLDRIFFVIFNNAKHQAFQTLGTIMVDLTRFFLSFFSATLFY